MKKLLVCVFVVFLSTILPCHAGVISIIPASPIVVSVSASGNQSLIDVAGDWGKIGIFAQGYYDIYGGADSYTHIDLSVVSSIDSEGNGVRAAISGREAINFAGEAVIDGSLSFQASNGEKSSLSFYSASKDMFGTDRTRTGNFRSGTAGISGYVGLELINDGQTYYGWMHLTVSSPDNYRSAAVTVDSLAWNNTAGSPIAAGSTVPEPATLALLSVGGILLRKRIK